MILHHSQQQGIIPCALKDACNTGVITNKVPDGHVSFITHDKLAELIDLIASEKHPPNTEQRYLITGNRFQTSDFFTKLQTILQDTYGITSTIETKADPEMETMCAMDESAIQRLKPDFNWGTIDDVVADIIGQNLRARKDIRKTHQNHAKGAGPDDVRQL